MFGEATMDKSINKPKNQWNLLIWASFKTKAKQMIKLGLFWTFESENDGQVLQNSIVGCKKRKVLFRAYNTCWSTPFLIMK